MTIEAFVRPRMRGVLHAAFFPLFLAAGIVLVTLAACKVKDPPAITAKLTANGRIYVQMFVVKPDPRSR